MEQEKIQQLEQRIAELEKVLKEHQHLGRDGSKEFDGETKIKCKEVMITGTGKVINLFDVPNFRLYDSGEALENRRNLSLGIGVSLKGEQNEQDNLIWQVGEGEITKNSNVEDWTKKNFSQVILSHSVKDYPWWVGDKALGAATFLTGKRTPIINGVGTITGKILVDNDADFSPAKSPSSLAEAKSYYNSMIHGLCIAKKYLPGDDTDFKTLEANRIIKVTKNSIICEREWDTSGKVRYEVTMPMILGSANVPFSLFYISDGIILGEGARTTNNPISSIRWGKGTPEGVVIASIGSLYLRQDGSTSTTLYIKETGSGNTGWVAK